MRPSNTTSAFTPIRGDAALQQAVAVYAGPKGNLEFPLDPPWPDALIAALTRLRVQQGAVKHRPRPAR